MSMKKTKPVDLKCDTCHSTGYVPDERHPQFEKLCPVCKGASGLFRGGQGRTAAEVQEHATACLWCMLGALALWAGLVIALLWKGCLP